MTKNKKIKDYRQQDNRKTDIRYPDHIQELEYPVHDDSEKLRNPVEDRPPVRSGEGDKHVTFPPF